MGRSVARSIVGHESSGILSEPGLDNVGEERKEDNGRARAGRRHKCVSVVARTYRGIADDDIAFVNTYKMKIQVTLK